MANEVKLQRKDYFYNRLLKNEILQGNIEIYPVIEVDTSLDPNDSISLTCAYALSLNLGEDGSGDLYLKVDLNTLKPKVSVHSSDVELEWAFTRAAPSAFEAPLPAPGDWGPYEDAYIELGPADATFMSNPGAIIVSGVYVRDANNPSNSAQLREIQLIIPTMVF